VTAKDSCFPALVPNLYGYITTLVHKDCQTMFCSAAFSCAMAAAVIEAVVAAVIVVIHVNNIKSSCFILGGYMYLASFFS
jgi:hypothetical protein